MKLTYVVKNEQLGETYRRYVTAEAAAVIRHSSSCISYDLQVKSDLLISEAGLTTPICKICWHVWRLVWIDALWSIIKRGCTLID